MRNEVVIIDYDFIVLLNEIFSWIVFLEILEDYRFENFKLLWFGIMYCKKVYLIEIVSEKRFLSEY